MRLDGGGGRGDTDDPRGGVRHVIPSRGNYLTKAAPLATGGERDPFVAHLRPLIRHATDITIVAAFVQQTGLDRLRPALEDALCRGARICAGAALGSPPARVNLGATLSSKGGRMIVMTTPPQRRRLRR